MNNPEYSPWGQIPPYAAWLFILAALGWFVAPTLGFILGGRRERIARIRKAYDTFDSIIASQLANLDAKKLGEAEFFIQSVPIITAATYSLRPFLPDKKWISMQLLLRE